MSVRDVGCVVLEVEVQLLERFRLQYRRVALRTLDPRGGRCCCACDGTPPAACARVYDLSTLSAPGRRDELRLARCAVSALQIIRAKRVLGFSIQVRIMYQIRMYHTFVSGWWYA